MWIVPKTLSAFVPDTEGLNLEFQERAWMLEQSAMWRSKPSSKQTWLRRLKKGGWITHLSTRILKPSQQKSFEEKFTDSLEDIPVSPSVVRGSEKEKKTQGTYGPTSDSTSGQLDLFGASLKMSEATPRWGYGESCPIWKKMVTERSGDCSARRKQARLTNASECSSWGTPQTSDRNGAADPTRKAHRTQLRDVETGHLPQGKKWLTPTTTDIVRSPEGMEKRKQYRESIGRKYVEGCLSEQVDNQQNWPTPRAGNPGSRKPGTGGKILAEEAKIHNGPPAPEKSSTLGKNQESWLTPKSRDYRDVENHILKTGENVRKTGQKFSVGLPTQAHMKEFPEAKKAQAKLNPNWVEQLMGLPIGWTDLGSWGTESSHKPQK